MLRTSILAICMLSFGCAHHTGLTDQRENLPASWEFERLAPQVYTPGDWPQPLEATVYQPRRPGSLPAVLVVHGGGWTRRSPADMERICKALAARGFVAVNVAYRLAPAYRYPAPVYDLRQALDWMVANAARLQVDPDRIGAFGYSAGAHLVSLLALLESAGHAPWGPPERGHRLRAVVAGGTPADLSQWPDSPLVNDFLGASRDADPDLWANASPISHVTADSPPFFLYHGGLDMLVEVQQTQMLGAKLEAAGVRAEVYTVPYHGHLSMFLLNRSAVRQGATFLRQML